MPTWMLTGGAGYIGAHVTHALAAAGHDVVVLDDLSTGVRSKVPPGVPLVEANVLDTRAVAGALRTHNVAGVVHLAAKKAVGESVARPLHYWEQNVTGLGSLLDACDTAGVGRVVFSSSAAAYGMPDVDVVTEDTPPAPISPYGETKLAGEWMVAAWAAARGARALSLRYFNVAGAGRPTLGDTGVFNLVPLVFQALEAGRPPQVFGADYPTPDGTCIRDYIHVADLADAHAAGADALESSADGDHRVVNISTGRGSSVLEVLASVARATGRHVAHEVTPRRPGDPARVVGSTTRAAELLGWRATRDLDDMVASAWEAWQVTDRP
jgi:UDP-glucose 4-epimerase